MNRYIPGGHRANCNHWVTAAYISFDVFPLDRLGSLSIRILLIPRQIFHTRSLCHVGLLYMTRQHCFRSKMFSGNAPPLQAQWRGSCLAKTSDASASRPRAPVSVFKTPSEYRRSRPPEAPPSMWWRFPRSAGVRGEAGVTCDHGAVLGLGVYPTKRRTFKVSDGETTTEFV